MRDCLLLLESQKTLYSSPPLSAGETSQDPQWMPKTVDSMCGTLHICIHVAFSSMYILWQSLTRNSKRLTAVNNKSYVNVVSLKISYCNHPSCYLKTKTTIKWLMVREAGCGADSCPGHDRAGGTKFHHTTHNGEQVKMDFPFNVFRLELTMRNQNPRKWSWAYFRNSLLIRNSNQT